MSDVNKTAEVVHDLKTWPEYFLAVCLNGKTFELRKDDRGFAVGDVLNLREWDPSIEHYTGHSIRRRVTYVLRDAERFGLAQGFVCMGIGP